MGAKHDRLRGNGTDFAGEGHTDRLRGREQDVPAFRPLEDERESRAQSLVTTAIVEDGPDGDVVGEDGHADTRRDGHVVDEDEKEKRAKDRALRNSSTNGKPGRLAVVRDDRQLTIREKSTNPAERPTLNTCTKELIEQARVPHPVEGRNDIKESNRDVAARCEGELHAIDEPIDLVERRVTCSEARLEAREERAPV